MPLPISSLGFPIAGNVAGAGAGLGLAAAPATGGASAIFEALPYILTLLGGALAPEGSGLSGIGNAAAMLFQQQMQNKYLEKKRADPNARAPIGLNPEFRLAADAAISSEAMAKQQAAQQDRLIGLQEQGLEQEGTQFKERMGFEKDRATAADTQFEKQFGLSEKELEIRKQAATDEQSYRTSMLGLQQQGLGLDALRAASSLLIHDQTTGEAYFAPGASALLAATGKFDPAALATIKQFEFQGYGGEGEGGGVESTSISKTSKATSKTTKPPGNAVPIYGIQQMLGGNNIMPNLGKPQTSQTGVLPTPTFGAGVGPSVFQPIVPPEDLGRIQLLNSMSPGIRENIGSLYERLIFSNPYSPYQWR